MPAAIFWPSVRDSRFLHASGTLRQITSRVAIQNTWNASITSIMARSWQSSCVAFSQIQIKWWNGFVNSSVAGVETGPGASTTLAMSIEYPRGTFTQLTFGGASTGTVGSNAIVASDVVDLGFVVPAYRWFRIGFYASNPNGVPYSSWANLKDARGGDEFATNANGTDKTMGGTIVNLDMVSMLFPNLVLGYSDRVVWGVHGDSITAGVNDYWPDPSGGRGLFGRGLAPLVPHVNFGCPGDRAEYFVGSHTARTALMLESGATRIIDAYGVNDINNSRTAAQLQSDRTAIRTYYPSSLVFDTTVTPQTTSTDGFRTAANQTITSASKNTQRIAFNSALRGPNVTFASPGVIDVAGLIETSTSNEQGPVQDGGVWIPGLVTDGTHPSSRASALLAPQIAGLVASQGG